MIRLVSISLLSCFALVSPAFADDSDAEYACYQGLLQGAHDSSVHAVNLSLDETELPADATEAAKALVLRVGKDVGCTRSTLKIEKASCKEVLPGQGASVACYVDTNQGFFFVTRDYMDSAYVIFNRWD